MKTPLELAIEDLEFMRDKQDDRFIKLVWQMAVVICKDHLSKEDNDFITDESVKAGNEMANKVFAETDKEFRKDSAGVMPKEQEDERSVATKPP